MTMTKQEYRTFENRVLDQKAGSRVIVSAYEYNRVMEFYRERRTVVVPLSENGSGFNLCGVYVIPDDPKSATDPPLARGLNHDGCLHSRRS